MRKLLQLMIALSSIFVASVAEAVPTAYYDRPTGNIYLQNDTSGAIPIVAFYSPSGRFTGMPNQLPGGPPDFSELPFSFAYFYLPPNGSDFPPNPAHLYNLGPVVGGKGPLGDLTLNYLITFEPGSERPGLFIEIPEPSTLVMAGVALGIPCLVQRAAG